MILLAATEYLTTLIAIVAGVVAALLEHFGKKKAAKQAELAAEQAKALVHGVEEIGGQDVLDALSNAAKEAGLDLDPDVASKILGTVHKAAKEKIKKTSIERNVGDLLADLVLNEGLSTRRLDPAKLRKKLEE